MLKNMKISARLITSYIIIALISGVVGIVGVYNLQSVTSKSEEMYINQVAPMGILNQLTEEFGNINSDVRDIIITNKPDEVSRYETSIKQRRSNITALAAQFEKTIKSNKVKESYSAFMDSRNAYSSYIDRVITLAKAGFDDDAFSLITSADMTKAFQAESEAIKNLADLKEADAKASSDSNKSTALRTVFLMLIIVAACMAIAIILGVYISRTMSKPMKKLIGAAERIADGDLNVFVETGSKDEIGDLSEAFRKMKEKLNTVMLDINAAAEQVATGSRQVSDSSIALSQGATEQASSIEELTASIEQISSQTKLNAENATQANELTEITKTNAIEGNTQMAAMIKAMEDINESSSNISRIIKVIDDIAFQTNILSLNAAVEAARAGQYGRGFAVVAEEVRNLAARSADAAKETTTMIESSIGKVKAGTKIANETATALNKIVADVEKVANLVSDIATASNEQSLGIDQINQGIMQVSQVVQTNSATSEESAAASEELSSQAELLKNQVSTFKVRREKSGKPENKAVETDSKETKTKASATDEKPQKDKPNRKQIILTDTEFGKY